MGSPEGVCTEKVQKRSEEIENCEEDQKCRQEIFTTSPVDFVEDRGTGEGRARWRSSFKRKGMVGGGTEIENEWDEQRAVATNESDDEHEERERGDYEVSGSGI